MRLLNLTLFMHNAAQGGGATIRRSWNSSVEYSLLAPPGRWLYVPVGTTFQLELQALEADFPFACPAGVVGGAAFEDQRGPQCSRPW